MTDDGGLSCEGLVIERAGTEIVRGVDLVVPGGQVTVLLGANGAGKTTLLEGLAGVIPVAQGTVRLNGTTVTKLRAGRRARLGLGFVETDRTVFRDLSVEDNLLVTARRAELQAAFDMFPQLARLKNSLAGLLSGGEQQMLVIARAVLRKPKVLILDEISLGLAPSIVADLLPRVAAVATGGAAILLVEQFAQAALAVGHRAYVMTKGAVAYEGDCTTLLEDPSLLHAAYLGDVGAETAPSGT